MKENGFAPGLVLIGILVIGLAIGGAYYLGTKKSSLPQPQQTITLSPTAKTTTSFLTTPNSNQTTSTSSPQSQNVVAQYTIQVNQSGNTTYATLKLSDSGKTTTVGVGAYIFLNESENQAKGFPNLKYSVNPSQGILESPTGIYNLPSDDYGVLKAVGVGTVLIIVTNGPNADTSSGKTYSNSSYNFSFNYPSDFTDSTSFSEYIPTYNLSNLIISLGKRGFQDTTAQYSQNANFSVSNSTDTISCYSFDSRRASITTQEINGTTFHVGKDSSAGGGHEIIDTVYRVIKGNTCYEIETSIESEIGGGKGFNSLSDKIGADQEQLQSELNQILSTFKFTN